MFARFKPTIFMKIVIILLTLLVPTVLLFVYTNNQSSELIRGQTIELNRNRSLFFKDQFESGADQMLKAGFTISKDPDSVKFQSWLFNSNTYNNVEFIQSLREKLGIQSSALIWSNELTIYSPETRQVASSNLRAGYDAAYFEDRMYANWTYVEKLPDSGEKAFFVRRLVTPFGAEEDPALTKLVAEVAFSTDNISRMLDNLKAGGGSEPFLYHPELPFIASGSADKEWMLLVNDRLHNLSFDGTGYEIIDIADQPYVMVYTHIPSIDWHLIDLTPMESLVKPIERNRNLFLLATGCLLILCVSAAAVVYRNVQVPVGELIRGLRRVMSGHYSERLQRKQNDEFGYLFEQYNRMANEIQTLVEQVHFEQVKVKEATVKQLQSQINPHFLYNSFAFIHSLAQLENYKAIMSASRNLSRYYRYSTRTDNPVATLGDEIELLRNYLEIMKLKLHRLDYSIDMPDEFKDLPVPRLVLQPAVENAVVHGIEPKEGDAVIAIRCERDGEDIVIRVEDNGVGMSEEALLRLERKLRDSLLGDESGCGLWNVHQRLVHLYGAPAGVQLEHSSSGGIRVTIRFKTGGAER